MIALIFLQSKAQFIDDIDGLAGEREELAKLVERLDKAYGSQISAEKTKLISNNNTSIKN